MIGKTIDNTNLSDFWQRSKDMVDNRIENSELSRFIDFNSVKVDGTAAITPLDKVADYVIARDEDRGYIKGTVGEYLFVSRDLFYTRSGNYDPVGDFTIEAGVYKIAKVVPSDETTISNGIDGCVAFTYAYDGDDYVERVYTLEELQVVVNGKVDKVSGKGLSTNDYTNEDKNKLREIESGAEANVQTDWEQDDDTQDDFIKHKPSIPSKISDLENDSDFVHGISGSQMLRGTNTIEKVSSSTWETSTWGYSSAATVSDANNPPVPDIKKEISLPLDASLTQYYVPVIYGETYTVSCYVKGTGQLKLDFTMNQRAFSGSGKTFDIDSTTWQKCSYTFKANIRNESENFVDVKFSHSATTGTLDICGMKLELGTQATQWSLSPYEMDNSNVDLSGIESDIDTLETNQTQILSDIEDLEHSLSTTSTATGNPISISDSAHVNAEELKVELEPIQDLHGYDKPWVGGAGKNKLPLVLADIKSVNTSGTWSGNTYTVSGITFTVNSDNDGNIMGIGANGTASEVAFFGISVTLQSGTYEYNGCPQNGAPNTYRDDIRDSTGGGVITASIDVGNGGSVVINATTTVYFSIRIESGYTASNLIFYPMIRLATETDSTFEPYSNICPISGYDETSVVVKDTAENPTVTNTYTLQFGDTVYGAEVDFVRGVATVTKGYIAEYAGETLPSTWISDRDVYASGTTPTTGAEVVYELATPTTIQLTPQQIKMLKGNNVLVADGEMSLEYQVDSVVGDVKEWCEDNFIPYNTYRTPPVYGFHIDGSNSDPSSRVTYIADNANFMPAYMDYSADKFRYNSWRDIWFVKECKPCILNQDGTVKAYLNPNDYTKDVDGNTVAIDENLTGANVMTEFPKIWYKVVPDADDETSASVYFSPVKVDEDYKDYAYIDKDGVHKEHFYMPAYNGSVLDGTTVMRSISGQAVSKNLDASTEIAYAKANGDGWNTEDAGEIMLINFLLILLGKSTDTQTVFGRGIDTGDETAFNNYVTGAGNLKGLFYGTNTGTGLVKVFGIENWWGLQWRRYAGDVLDNGVRKVKMCYGNEDGSATFDFNIDGTGYVDVGVTPSGTSGGYIRTMKFVHDGMYSAISDGSSSTYFCDGQWFNNAYHTIYAFRGGSSAAGLRCGSFCVNLYIAPEGRDWGRGAAVSYK